MSLHVHSEETMHTHTNRYASLPSLSSHTAVSVEAQSFRTSQQHLYVSLLLTEHFRASLSTVLSYFFPQSVPKINIRQNNVLTS